MKRIAVRRMVVVAVLAIVLAVFFLTPVVYLPYHIHICGGPPNPLDLPRPQCEPGILVTVYESPSCLLFGLGFSGDNYSATYFAQPMSYSSGCPPHGDIRGFVD
ncbi:MAG: hypothetical protein ACLP9K_10310 [Nitrososphaerales archaeon]